MANRINRREFVERVAGGALALPIVARAESASPNPAAANEKKDYHGIFAILETPFTPSNAIDEEDLAHEVDFCVRCGVHGLVWPQLAAEFFLLSEEERMRGAEVIIRAAAGRRPVVIGVQEPYKGIAVNSDIVSGAVIKTELSFNILSEKFSESEQLAGIFAHTNIPVWFGSYAQSR